LGGVLVVLRVVDFFEGDFRAFVAAAFFGPCFVLPRLVGRLVALRA